MTNSLYIPNFEGSRISDGRWTPESVAAHIGSASIRNPMTTISHQEAIFWFRGIGGKVHHEQHPVNTLLILPKIILATCGSLYRVGPTIRFGTAPYTFTLGVGRPSWVSLDSVRKVASIRPTDSVEPGEYTLPVQVDDAANQTDTSNWTITVR